MFGPALRAESATGVLHHVRICKAKGRGGSVAGGVEEVEVVGKVPNTERVMLGRFQDVGDLHTVAEILHRDVA